MKGLPVLAALLVLTPAAKGADLFYVRVNPSNSTQEEFRALEKNRELRQVHGQSSLYSETEYQERNRATANRVVREFQETNLKNVGERSEAYLLSRDLGPFRAPIAASVFLAGVYTGREIKKNVGRNTRVRFHTDVRNHGGHYMGLDSQVVDAEVAVKTADGQKVALAKNVPGIDVRTGVQYNLSSRAIATTASRNIMNGLDLVVDHRTGQDPENTAKLVYGIQF